jgi:hypothetical protein
MSKNLTRKGLALGALVALGSSVIAGAPAQAAQTLTISPAAGTSYNTTLGGAQFALTAVVGNGTSDAAAATLKFSIANPGSNLQVGTVGVGVGNAAAATAAGAASGTASTSATILTAAATGLTAGKSAAIKIGATAAATPATINAVVTAWLDQNGNDVVDANEDTAAPVTVKFLANGDITAVASITAPLIGDLALTASATISPELNLSYATDVQLQYTSATAITGGPAFAVVNTAGVYAPATKPVIAAATAGDYKAQVKTAAGVVGNLASVTVAAVTTYAVTAGLVAGNDATAAGVVRATAKSASITGALTTTATNHPAAGAGIPVVATVTQTVGTPATSLITVAGKAITATATTIALTTDASGKVSMPLTSATGTLGDTVTVVLKAEGVSSSTLSIVWTAVAYTLTDTKDETAASTLRAMTRGGKLVLDYYVKDQFGVAISGGARVKTVTSGGTTNTQYNNLVNGKVSVTVTDTQTSTTTSNVVTSTVETQDSATLNWTANVASATPAALTAAVSSTAFSFDTVPNQTAGTFTGTVSADAYTGTPTNAVSITGASSAALSTAVAGQSVTVSGAGLAFLVNSKVYADSVTFFSGTTGDFTVSVYSTKSGAQTVTFTTGTATSSVVVTFAAGAPVLASLVAPAQAQVGQALDIVINVTDKWGNAVASASSGTGVLSVSSTGTGYFASAAPVANAAGKATVKYIVGTADIGTAYLSATIELGATDFTTAKSIEFGLTDADVVAGGHRVFVNAEFAKGRTVTVSVDGVRVYSKVQATDNAVELAFTQKKKGAHTVTVRISGGIVFTERVITN